MTTEQTPAALAAEIKRLHHDYAKTRVPGPELFEAIDRLEALASAAQGATEVREDGKTVRKDRWEIGIRRIVALMWGNHREFEVDDVVDAVAKLVKAPFNDDERAVMKGTP